MSAGAGIDVFVEFALCLKAPQAKLLSCDALTSQDQWARCCELCSYVCVAKADWLALDVSQLSDS